MSDYRYTECGLDNVVLANGFNLEETPYGSGVTIKDVEGLHRCIGQLLVDKPSPLTPAEFRFLRTELDLSQHALAAVLDCTERTVRGWESGKPKIPGAIDRLIRLIYREANGDNATYIELVHRLQDLDREWHDMLRLQETEEGWREAS